ncbi:hypothetical protein evm_000057 [Chilo suppressalis]|nr:hypothetical protein evm_000057 [Chilo suppressalis]
MLSPAVYPDRYDPKTFKKKRTPSLKAGIAFVTLLVLPVSMGDGDHLPSVVRSNSFIFQREKKRKINGSSNELKILNDSLQKENVAKDREILRLNKDVQHYEQAIINLRNELSLKAQQNSNVSKKDAEVMAGMCCTGNECGDWEPVRECSMSAQEVAAYQERIQKMEANLKESSCSVRALRKVNAGLSEEVHALRHACAALQEQCRAAALHAQFKDDIIREMRRQLHQAKGKLKELSDPKRGCLSPSSGRECSASLQSVTITCARHHGAGDDAISSRLDSD